MKVLGEMVEESTCGLPGYLTAAAVILAVCFFLYRSGVNRRKNT